jgi:hypothetical protein
VLTGYVADGHQPLPAVARALQRCHDLSVRLSNRSISELQVLPGGRTPVGEFTEELISDPHDLPGHVG